VATLFPSRFLGVEVVERYAKALVQFAGSPFSRAITFSSGSDAVEGALKLALQWHQATGQPRRTKFIGRRGSYHGNTLGCLGAGGFLRRRRPFEGALAQVAKAASAHCAACEFGLEAARCRLDCADSVEEAIMAEGADTVAAVIVEPVVGAALSAAVPDARYLGAIRRICDRHGVLLIADEVMTGFGRTGARFASHHWNLAADIMVCGKAISAGYYPLSALIVSAAVERGLNRAGQFFQNGQTYACSPVAAAVGLAVIERLQEEDLPGNARAMGELLLARLAAAPMHGRIRNLRGLGLMTGFDIASAPGLPPGAAADALQRAALRRSLLIYGSSGSAGAESGDHAMLLPPLNIREDDVDIIVARLSAAAADVTAGGG
jgi:adenosylmethionine-8-amino-7-oxononanoate aminotransferase